LNTKNCIIFPGKYKDSLRNMLKPRSLDEEKRDLRTAYEKTKGAIGLLLELSGGAEAKAIINFFDEQIAAGRMVSIVDNN
jgi:hypothetical protein